MKFLELFFMGIILLSFSGFSQNFNGGLIGGVSTTQISGDQLGGFDKPGIYAGCFVNYFVNEDHGYQIEMSFIQKGSRKLPHPDKNDFTSYSLNMNYLEVPVLYKYRYNEKFGAKIGPYYAVLFKSVERDENGVIPRPSTTPEFKKGDFGIGGGFEYFLTEHWMLNVSMSHSILKVRDHSSGSTYRLNRGQYHHVLSFAMFYTF